MKWLTSPILRGIALPLVVTAVTLRSLGAPGYLVQVDATFGPRPDPLTWTFYAPVELVLRLLQLIGGGQLAGRAYVAAALFDCGFAAMVLLRDMPWWAQSAGGLLAILNPFVYDRLVEGQWGVVMATAGLFLLMAAWVRMRRQPTWRSGALVAG